MNAEQRHTQQNTEYTPADSPCNLFHLRRAARAVSRQYGAVMKSTDAQAPQFSVLFILSRAGSLSITELASRMGMDRTSMSRNLLPMQAHGLISVGAEGAARARDVSITEAGRAALADLMPMWRQAQSEFVEHLGEADTALLISLLQRVATIDARRQ